MSVLKNKQKPSGVQFLDNMKQLHADMLSLCIKCPKRWDRFITGEIAKLSNSALTNVKCGNSIRVMNEQDLERRVTYLSDARCELQALVSLADNLYDYCNFSDSDFTIKDTTISNLMLELNNEIGLITGVIKSDKEKFRKSKKSKG